MLKFTIFFILAFLGLCQAKPGLFDLFSDSECKPIVDADTCAIVYDDEDCEEGMYYILYEAQRLEGYFHLFLILFKLIIYLLTTSLWVQKRGSTTYNVWSNFEPKLHKINIIWENLGPSVPIDFLATKIQHLFYELWRVLDIKLDNNNLIL